MKRMESTLSNNRSYETSQGPHETKVNQKFSSRSSYSVLSFAIETSATRLIAEPDVGSTAFREGGMTEGAIDRALRPGFQSRFGR